MSEHIQSSKENHKPHEQLISKEQQKHSQELAVEKARKALLEHAEKDHQALAHEAAKHAQESHKTKPEATAENRENQSLPGVQQSMKNRAYKRELAKIQTKLPAPSRRFSKIVHSTPIESLSNIGAQTVARPSGLLGGSIVAFTGSLVLYYMAKEYGFRYNYLLMFFLFAGGFMLGAMIELIVWYLSGRKRITAE